MDALLANWPLRLFGITYVILVLKMIAVGWCTSYYRLRDKTTRHRRTIACRG